MSLLRSFDLFANAHPQLALWATNMATRYAGFPVGDADAISIPNISLVVLNLVLLKKIDKFISK